MKKFILLILCFSMILTVLASCGDKEKTPTVSDTSDTPSDDTSKSIEQSEEVSESSEDPEEESTPEIIRTWPYITASFIQLWRFTSYTAKRWEKHFDYLLEAGIDTVIIQASSSTKDGKITGAYYPCKIGDKKYTAKTIETILSVCKAKGMKVIMGLNNPEDWFSINLTSKEYYIKEAELGVETAREIYDLFHEEYGDVITAWYFVPEYYSGIGNTERGAELLNIYIDGLNSIDPSMPMLLSPFLRNAYSPEQVRDEWIAIFKNTHFREGDIFCCQDSVGGGGIMLEQLDAYYAALKQACDTKNGLHFWANNENFTTSGKPAPLDRFVKQLEISDKYVEGHITFSYSHYAAPDIVNQTETHQEYVEYYNTGKYYDPAKEEQFVYEGTKTLVSKDAPYTGTVNTRSDGYIDDGKKLTDGVIPSADGNTNAYFGCTADSGATITIDLGQVYDKLSEFEVINSFGAWGITKIENVTYYVSEDNKKWQKAGTVESYNQSIVETKGEWMLYDFKLVTKEAFKGRYVKAVIENGGYMWIGEICVYNYDERK